MSWTIRAVLMHSDVHRRPTLRLGSSGREIHPGHSSEQLPATGQQPKPNELPTKIPMNYEPPSIQESLAGGGTVDAAARRCSASKEFSKGSPAPKPTQHTRSSSASTPWDVLQDALRVRVQLFPHCSLATGALCHCSGHPPETVPSAPTPSSELSTRSTSALCARARSEGAQPLPKGLPHGCPTARATLALAEPPQARLWVLSTRRVNIPC